MKIAFLMSDRANDGISSWPGTRRFMAEALSKHCGEVVFVRISSPRHERPVKTLSWLLRISTGRKYDYKHSRRFAVSYAKQALRQVSELQPDAVFVPGMAAEAAFMGECPPIIYTSDATFAAVRDYYPVYSRLLSISVRETNLLEQTMIDRADLVLYPSNWAAQSALSDYHAEESKVHVAPYGANIYEEDIPPFDAVVRKNRSGRCKLLFLATDWKRKGGDIAFDTLKALEKNGVPSELIVCGCVPPDTCRHERMTVIPFIDKSHPADRRRLSELLLCSDYLLLPTRCECYGMVFCEASAFGLPSITTRTGGIPGAVTDGANGFMLPLDATAQDFASTIQSIHDDSKRREELVRTSRIMFDEKLSWNAWGKTVDELIKSQ